jgi:hypothetical protein
VTPSPPVGDGEHEGESTETREPFRFLDHWGMISGAALGVIFLAFLVLLAVAGDPGALAVLAVLIVGVALIYLGGQLHGRRAG